MNIVGLYSSRQKFNESSGERVIYINTFYVNNRREKPTIKENKELGRNVEEQLLSSCYRINLDFFLRIFFSWNL